MFGSTTGYIRASWQAWCSSIPRMRTKAAKFRAIEGIAIQHIFGALLVFLWRLSPTSDCYEFLLVIVALICTPRASRPTIGASFRASHPSLE